MKCQYACGTSDHTIARRTFLGGLAAGTLASGFGGMSHKTLAKELQSRRKQVLVVFLAGGVSQLETWDPKPGTDTGGPFLPIATSVPGVHICELLPHTAKQMHRLALVRSINTKENNHGKGRVFMMTGRREEAPGDYPYLGAVMAKALTPAENPLPAQSIRARSRA